jgi:hypothetical protein
MAYSLSVNEQEKYIEFKLSGELTEPEINSAIMDLQRERDKHKFSCVLCDQLDLQVPPDDLAGFFAAKRLSSGPFAGIKLAIVRTDATKERLFEIAANNRSAVVKVFDNRDEAKQWLQND